MYVLELPYPFLSLNFVQYSLVHGQKVLQAHIENLKLSISDQNLDLIPDYEQRIEVLQGLRFIDKNCTVLLKGRVACEVCGVVFSTYKYILTIIRSILQTSLF